MNRHGPTCLEGPISRKRAYWQETAPRSEVPENTEFFRAALVERIRQEIAAGTYDTPERWDAALDRLATHVAIR